MQYEIVTVDNNGTQVPQTDDQGNVMVRFSYNGRTLDQNIFMAPTKQEFLDNCQAAYDVFVKEIDTVPQTAVPSYIDQLSQG